MDALAIAAEYLPGHDDVARRHVLMSYTSYPALLPRGEGTLRTQLAAYQDASQRGLELCLGCGMAHPLTSLDRRSQCATCRVALRALRAA